MLSLQNLSWPTSRPSEACTNDLIKHLFSDQKLAHHFTNVKNSNSRSLNIDVKALESVYWPGNEKELVATELDRHGEMRYTVSGPWNATLSEYYY